MFKTLRKRRSALFAAVQACDEDARHLRLTRCADAPERLGQDDLDYWANRFIQKRVLFWTGVPFTLYLLNPDWYETETLHVQRLFTRSLRARRAAACVDVPTNADTVCPN